MGALLPIGDISGRTECRSRPSDGPGRARPCGYTEGSSMTDRSCRDEERERRLREEDEKRRDDREKRSEELREAWRRRHPDEDERERRRRGKGGRAWTSP
jgi:hypothetical protein